MRKNIFFIVFLTIILTIAGCNTSIGVKENAANDIEDLAVSLEKGLKATDYYPFEENKIYNYEGIGNEYAEQKAFVEFIQGNRAQIKIINPGTNLIKVVDYSNGILSEIYTEGEFYHIENMLKTKSDEENIILKEPIVVGNSWTTKDGMNKEITNLTAIIDTPYSQFEALEVTTTYEDGNLLREYYAKNIGLVARIYDYGNYQIKTLLNTIEQKPLKHSSQFFYPLYSDTKSVYVEEKIIFYTNDSIEKIFEEKMKNPPSDKLIAPLSMATSINNIHFDRNNNWTVNIDFNEGFLNEMKMGTALESEILRSIVNTFGKFYDTERVYISVNGRPYESGHFSMNNDEGFLVDTEGIEEFKIK